MAESSSQDRTLPATARRIEKAREQGQVARSRDLGHFAALGLGIALVAFFAQDATQGAGALLREGLRFDAAQIANPALMLQRLADLGLHMVMLLLPLLLVSSLVAVGSGLASGGWNFTWEPLQPKFSKLNPLSGLVRVFTGAQLADTLKACALALLLGAVGGLYLRAQWLRHVELLAMPLPAALAAGGDIILTGLLLMGGVLAAFALVDVPLQRFMLARKLRMSMQEVKEEFKEVDGNPEIKQRRKQRMREMANRRMLAAVPEADLVVMNPTHYAVALKYDEHSMAAPRVVAKGADLMALRIRDLARDSKVPVLQAPPLARALYAHTELDAEVPARLYSAVAQVLAWVFQLREAMAAGRSAPLNPPTPEVPADMDPANAKATTTPEAALRKDPEL
jgi:flagellar biosynthesis protein FlhB